MGETEPVPDDGTAGMVRSARAFLAGCARYCSARLRLASIEGREAAAFSFKLFLVACAVVVFGTFGWLFLCLTAVFLLAQAFGGGAAWVWSALLMAALHLGFAALLLLVLKSKIGRTLFPLTTAELKKDQEWLDQQTTKNRQS